MVSSKILIYSHTAGVWCLVFVWCLRCLVFGVWCFCVGVLVFGVCGVWCLVFGVWCFELFGVWCLYITYSFCI
jgi:hypothetical protein